MRTLKTSVGASIILSVNNPGNSVLALHELIIRNKGIAFIDTSLTSVFGSLKGKVISYFTSESGRASLSLSMECNTVSECLKGIPEVARLIINIIKTLSPKMINLIEHVVRTEIRVSGLEVEYDDIDKDLLSRGFMKVSRDVKHIESGGKAATVITYTYKYVAEALSIINVSIVYTISEFLTSIRLVLSLRGNKLSLIDKNLNNLMSMCKDVSLIINSHIK